METLITIYMIVSIIFALSALTYVVVDVVIEVLQKLLDREPKEEPVIVQQVIIPEPEPEPEPEIIESAPVEIPEDLPEPESVETGVEVIDVAWPESMARNKIYRYDPNGSVVERGDTVLVPTFDKHRKCEVLRTATVINGNYRTDSLPADKVLKKVVRVVK